METGPEYRYSLNPRFVRIELTPSKCSDKRIPSAASIILYRHFSDSYLSSTFARSSPQLNRWIRRVRRTICKHWKSLIETLPIILLAYRIGPQGRELAMPTNAKHSTKIFQNRPVQFRMLLRSSPTKRAPVSWEWPHPPFSVG